MSHWASEYMEDIEEQLESTEWDWRDGKPDAERGPLWFEHEDGSTIRVMSASVTGTFPVEYTPSEDASAGVVDKSVSYNDRESAIEWLLIIISQHTKKNEE